MKEKRRYGHMCEQPHREAAGRGGQQSPHCSRATLDGSSLAARFDLPPGAPSFAGGCGQTMAGPVDVEDLASFCSFSSQPQSCATPQYGCTASQPQYGCTAGQPQYGCTAGQTQYGCTAGQTQYGCTAGQTQYGCTVGQTQYGCTASQPQYGCTSGQPEYGCSSGQPQNGYTAGQPQYGCTAGQPQYECSGGGPDAPRYECPPQRTPAYSEAREPYYSQISLEEAAFGYCTDARWMACPATSYCPLYDASQQPLESWRALPCAQDFRAYYATDEEALEEYLSNEKRKEKSRDAARCRRSRETDIFTELAAALPVPQFEAAHLDKASVMRLAIAYLKTRTLMDAVPKPLAKPEVSSDMDELFLKALDGFVLSLDNNGDMVYLSPNVKDYLGIPQMDLMGQSVFDYSHPCDHDEIRESLSLKTSEISEDQPCNFFLRLKCTLTNKGRKVNLKSASYKVMHCTGRLIAHLNPDKESESKSNSSNNNNNNASDSEDQEENVEKEPGVSLVFVASPVPHPSNIETPLGKYTFLSKHNLNMKFTYADDKLAEFLGWESNELMGQSVFDFHHALDNLSLDKSFKSLFSKGQCETMAYRFLNKRGGYAWVVTQATLIHCTRLQKPLSVVCVNYMLSGVECEDEVYSVRQLEARAACLKEEPRQQHQQPVPEAPRKPLADRPVAVTASLFRVHKPEQRTPKTENKENDEAREKSKAKAKVPVCEVHPQPQCKQQQQPPPPQLDYVPLPIPEPDLYQQPVSSGGPAPQTATASIFAPRTKDMNKGFLTFVDDQPGLTMLKDEPEDLTHLAPTAGDVCVPLDDPPFLSDMLDEFMNANYCPLLSPELPNGPPDLVEPACNPGVGRASRNPSLKEPPDHTILRDPLRTDDCSSSDGDPFIYRDSPSRCSLGTDLHSPTLTKSPEGSGVGDSLSSPNGSGGGLSEDEMLMLSISDVMADDELALRAPYIPMSDQDEALQMLISDDMVMWGPSQSNDKKSKWLTDAGEENANSSLAQLLTNETSSKKMKDHGGTLVNPSQVLGQISLKSTAKDITAERERTNKRVHAYSSRASHESKRLKHNDTGPPVSRSAGLENILSASVQSSQLLQQLVSQQRPSKSRDWSEQLAASTGSGAASDPQRCRNGESSLFDDSSFCGLNDEGGGIESARRSLLKDDGGGKAVPTGQRRSQQPQQSNSVLMNLLVSGCDMQGIQSQLQDPSSALSTSGLLLQPQEKLAGLPMIVEEQLQTVPQWPSAGGPLSPVLGPPDKQQPAYAALGYGDELGFINDPSSILQDSDELLRVLDSSLC